MPLYEYTCPKCEAKREELRSLHDKEILKCEQCGLDMQKIPALSNFQLKGQGWHKTDYPKKTGQ